MSRPEQFGPPHEEGSPGSSVGGTSAGFSTSRRESSMARSPTGVLCPTHPAETREGATDPAASAINAQLTNRIKSCWDWENMPRLPLSSKVPSSDNRNAMADRLGSWTLMLTLPALNLYGKRTIAVVGLSILLGVVGCRKSPVGFERFNPPPGASREALNAVLEAWRAGRPAEDGVGPESDVHVVDKQRKPGQRLVGFEILGEVNVEKGRGYAVRLRFDEPEETSVVRFLVIGERPLWVWRKEDFDMIAHWMHPMDDEKDKFKEKSSDSPKTP